MSTTKFDQWLRTSGPQSRAEAFYILDAVEVGGSFGEFSGFHKPDGRVFVKRRGGDTLALVSKRAISAFVFVLRKKYLSAEPDETEKEEGGG
jgi:hypothetical protein